MEAHRVNTGERLIRTVSGWEVMGGTEIVSAVFRRFVGDDDGTVADDDDTTSLDGTALRFLGGSNFFWIMASTDVGIFDSVKSFKEKIRASTNALTVGIASFASTPFFTIALKRREICSGLVVAVVVAMP